jgi:two-component system phosphate regulon sensor histidine kinase PhoR
MIWIQALIPAAVALAIGAVLGALFSSEAAAWWIAVALALLAFRDAIRLARLHHWAALPRQRDLPRFSSGWRQMLERLERFLQQEKEHQGELNEELAQLHAAVDQLPDGLTLIDRYDHVEWRNKAAEHLHGIFASGRPIHHFVRQPEFIDYLSAGDFARPPIIALPSSPGRLFELRVHPTENEGKLLITRDVTNQARLDTMRRDFVANVSHEIRTPVTVIGGFAETMLTLDLDDTARRDYLQMILKQSQTMQRLVDDLLTLSSLESSNNPPTEERVELHELALSLTAEARALSQGRHAIEVRFEQPVAVQACAGEIESALRNLLTNAVRYTPEGGTIGVEWRIHQGNGELTVRDTGIGIAAEHLPRLSERFYRVDRGRSRETGGTGLGLAIVKHIMTHHGGRLLINSRIGVGSAFTLSFPGRRLLEAVRPAMP